MDQKLLRSYLGTAYEFATDEGVLRASLDGDPTLQTDALPSLLQGTFALVTAYNPRSMLLPRRVNEQRHQVLRDLLILGCHRVEPSIGYDEEPDGMWREPTWIAHGIERQEAVIFGRAFRQNTIVYCTNGKPELIATDPTCDPVEKSYQASWRVRS